MKRNRRPEKVHFIEALESRLLCSVSAYKLPGNSVAPLTVISLGTGSAKRGDNVQVTFSDGAGFSVTEAASSVKPVRVEVPIYVSPATFLPSAGKLIVSVGDNGNVTQLPGKLRVTAPPAAKGRPGTATLGFVQSEETHLTTAENALLPTITVPETQTAVEAEIDAVRGDLAEQASQLQAAIAGGPMPTLFVADPPDLPAPVTLTVPQLRSVDAIISDENKKYGLDEIFASLPTPKQFAENLHRAAEATEKVLALTAFVAFTFPVDGALAAIGGIAAAGYLISTFTPVIYTGVIDALTQHSDPQDWTDLEGQVFTSSASFLASQGVTKFLQVVGKVALPKVDKERISAPWEIIDGAFSLMSGRVSALISRAEGKVPATTGGGVSMSPNPPSNSQNPPTDPGSSATDPGVIGTSPGSTTADPGSTSTDPGSTAPDPGSTQTDPGATTTDPGASPTNPGTASTDPGSTSPGSTSPGSTTTDPGSTSTSPEPGANPQIYQEYWQYGRLSGTGAVEQQASGFATLTIVETDDKTTINLSLTNAEGVELPTSITLPPLSEVSGGLLATENQTLNGEPGKWAFVLADNRASLVGSFTTPSTIEDGRVVEGPSESIEFLPVADPVVLTPDS